MRKLNMQWLIDKFGELGIGTTDLVFSSGYAAPTPF